MNIPFLSNVYLKANMYLCNTKRKFDELCGVNL